MYQGNEGMVHREVDRRNMWPQIRPDPRYHPPGARMELSVRDDRANMPPPPRPAGGQDQSRSFMQHRPELMQRPGAGADYPSRQAGTTGNMAPPPTPYASARGSGGSQGSIYPGERYSRR